MEVAKLSNTDFLLRKTPRTPEIDFSGVVSEESKFSTSCPFKPGDEVYGHVPPVEHVLRGIGTLAEQIAVSANWFIRKPEELSHVQAAALPTSFVSAYKLANCVTPGTKVFINGGSGGIGLLLIQLLKTWKEAIVTTTASSQSRVIVEQQKPDYIVDYREVGGLASYLEDHYEPFDYCIDLIGDSKLLRQSNRFLAAYKGCFIAFGGGLGSSSIYQFVAWLVRTLFIGYMPRWLGMESISSFR
jgi:NADPH:quinone reductase-like Zn-dependent oxidoreductase